MPVQLKPAKLVNINTLFFYKQHFYKQHQAKIGKKLSEC